VPDIRDNVLDEHHKMFLPWDANSAIIPGNFLRKDTSSQQQSIGCRKKK